MDQYDPEKALDATEWLALDEAVRLNLVDAYHRDARIRLPKAARRIHASIHTIVENQLASDDEPVVRALARLIKEGLSRHDAVHAIGSCVAHQIYDLLHLKEPPGATRTRYYESIERLTVAEWRKNAG